MSAVLHRSAGADVRRTWLDLFWSPPASAPPARPSLLPVLHRSAGADVRPDMAGPVLVASCVGSARSSLVLPVLHRSAGADVRRTWLDLFWSPLRRLRPLVPRSYLCCTAPLGPTFVGHGWTCSGRLLRRLRPLVPRSYPCCTAPQSSPGAAMLRLRVARLSTRSSPKPCVRVPASTVTASAQPQRKHHD